MKRFVSVRTLLSIMAVPIVALLGYAWVDGGREPLRDIVQPLPIPAVPK